MPMRARFVSLHTLATALVIGFPLAGAWPAFARPVAERAAEQQSSPSPAVAGQRMDPQAWFAKGQTALQNGDLDAAEAAFRWVLAVDPRAGSAYANLGVIAMRRKNWDHAIRLLHRAEKLEPKMAGVRLNIGLVEYRRGNYACDRTAGFRGARPAGLATSALPAGTLPSLHEEICGGGDSARTAMAAKVQ